VISCGQGFLLGLWRLLLFMIALSESSLGDGYH
jgi:hypothetical protein